MANNMRKYIPLVLFIFLWPVLSADIHGRVVRVLDGDTIEVMDSRKAVRIRLVNIDAPEKKQDYGRWSTDTMKSLVAGKTYSSGRGSEAAGIPLLRSHDARKLLQMTGEWLNTTGADQQSPEHHS